MKRDDIDLHQVEPIHYVIHGRLENWARYIRDGKPSTGMQPMFRYYVPYLVAREPGHHLGAPDSLDAMKVEKGVANLPEKHAYAVRWCYVFPWKSQFGACKEIGVRPAGMLELIRESRSMLKNRLTNPIHVL